MRLDLIGKVFGQWTVLFESKRSKDKKTMWQCLCSCGTEKPVKAYTLLKGTSVSCGCTSRTIHGLSQNCSTYTSWAAMKKRCLNPKTAFWDDYGGRGIIVCDRWMNFKNFYEDMGLKPEGLSLDRIDNDKGYYPGNCKWSTSIEQRANQRESKRGVRIVYQGETMTIRALSIKVGMTKSLLAGRILEYGWTVEKAVNTPKKVIKNNRVIKGVSNGMEVR